LGYKTALTTGLLLLGLPAFLYSATEIVVSVLLITLARGAGFGILTVAFSALAVELATPERRGEAIGLLGVAITLPGIFCHALGLWIAEHVGFGLVFLLGGAAPLLGFGIAQGLRSIESSHQHDKDDVAGFLSGFRRVKLLRICLLFASSTVAFGVVFTFLPLAVSEPTPFSATIVLVLVGLTTTVGRWWAGRYCDRHDPFHLLAPALIIAAFGMIALSYSGWILLSGGLLFGSGLGLLQSTTLTIIMNRVEKTEYGLGSTLWNVAYDAGIGLGAMTFGVLIPLVGFTVAFYLCSALLVSALFLAYADRTAENLA
jgi:predicted MFS family arabinose efflux permease